MDFLFTIAGFSVGFVIGMTGVGGGSLMTPILVLGFSIPPAIAVGTDLLYAAITKSVGVFAHQKHGNIKWKVVALLSMGSIPASICSIFIIKHLNNTGTNYDQLILSSLSFAMILTATFLIFRNQWHKLSKNEHFAFVKILHKKYTNLFTIFAGILIGTLVTFSSVGAGVIGAAFLFFLYPIFFQLDWLHLFIISFRYLYKYYISTHLHRFIAVIVEVNCESIGVSKIFISKQPPTKVMDSKFKVG